MNKRYFQLIIWILMFTPLLSGCGSSQEPLPVVRIGHAPHDHHSPLYIAAMNPDYFNENGGLYLKEVRFREEYELVFNDLAIAKVMIESSTGGRELIRRLSEEQYDISFGGVPSILNFIDKGRPIHMLSPIMAEGAGLVVRNDIPASNWKDFENYVKQRKQPLRIGYKTAISVQNLIFEKALSQVNIPFSTDITDSSIKVALVNLNGAKNLIPALDNKVIDGFVVMQPFLALAETKGSGKMIALLRDMPPEGRWHGHPCCAVAANDRFVKLRPEISKKLLTLLLRARRHIIDYPDKSAQQIAKWLGMPVEVEKRSIPSIDFDVKLDDAWNRGIDGWLDAMIESGRISGRVSDAYKHGKTDELLYNRELYRQVSKELE